MQNETAVDPKMTIITADRETLHALARNAGADVGVGTAISRDAVRDLARKIANATAASGGKITIRVVD